MEVFSGIIYTLSEKIVGLKGFCLSVCLPKSWDSWSRYELYICLSGFLIFVLIISMNLHAFQCTKLNYAVPGKIQKSVNGLKILSASNFSFITSYLGLLLISITKSSLSQEIKETEHVLTILTIKVFELKHTVCLLQAGLNQCDSSVMNSNILLCYIL